MNTERAQSNVGWRVSGVRVLAVLGLVLSAGAVSVTPQSSDPIPGYLAQVNSANLTAVATDLVTLYGPRREDTFSPYIDGSCTVSGVVYPQTTLDMAADYIRDRFLAMGYPSSAITFEVLPGGAGRNVYVTKTGTTYPNVFIEFSGHYDSVGGSPGGADNASGSTAVIELARVLKDYPSRYSMRFILWAAEEFSVQRNAAYYGSTFHVQQALLRGEQIKAGLVMDHIGWANPADPTGYFNEVSYIDAESNRIADLFDSVRGQYALELGFGKDYGIQNSDEHSYWAQGQVAVSSGGGWLFQRPNYHSCGDTAANIDFVNVQRVAQQNLAVGLKLDAEPFGAAGTTTTLASSPSPSLLGQAVTLTAAVAATTGTPTGTVTFRDGANTLGTAPLNASAMASLTTSDLSVGLHSLTASYSGDASHSGSSSIAVVHTVNETAGTGPTISGLNPSAVIAGSPGFSLSVAGTNFTSSSVVRWNGSDRATTFVSSGELAAGIPATDVTSPGTAQVAVFNPGPGGGLSGALPFTISAAAPGDLRAAYGMEEGSGTTLSDSSGNANHGTLANGAGWGPGRYGSALAFDGLDDYVLIPNSPSIDLSGTSLTIEAWVNIAPGAPSGLLLAKPWVAGEASFPFYQYALQYDAGSSQVVFHYGTSSVGLRSFPMPAPASGWHHVAFTYDGPTAYVRGYVDAVEQFAFQVPFPLEVRGTPLLLGVDGALGNPFLGALDDVRIYGSARTAAEIQSDMATPVAAATLAIDNVVPGLGPVGTPVTIAGRGLAAATLIRFNATDQPSFVVVDDQTITTTVPPGATTGPVLVITPTATASSPAVFAVGSATNTALVSAPNPSAPGEWVTLTATVTAAVGTPSGTVTFRDGATDLGTAGLDGSGQATWLTNALASGTHSLTASYAGSGDHVASISPATSHVVSAVGNPVPVATTLTPASATAGGAAFTLTVTGSGYVGGTVVRWNGADRPTTVVSGSEVTVAIPASDLADAGTAQVTVVNPEPGGGLSGALPFTINAAATTSVRAAYGMEEGSGTTLFDSSGNANHGTVASGAGWGPGRYGSALVFDGIDDHVQIPNSASIDLSGTALTVEAWVNIAPGAASGLLLAKPWVAGQASFPSYQYALQYDAGSSQVIFHYGTSSAGLRSFPMPAPPSGWHHVAYTYDGPTAYVRGYVDGIEQFALQVPFPLEARGTPLLIGVDGALGNPFQGALDDIRIYGSARSAAEILADMATPIGGPTVPSISTIDPASGPVGTSISITGSGLSGATLVRFNTTEQPAFTIVDATTITTSVPAGAATGFVQVVTPEGTATSAIPFTVTSVTPELSINSIAVAEGGPATFTVTLSEPSSQVVTVVYATSDGSAVAGADYVARNGTLTFDPGVTTLPVAVDVLADALDELDETFTVTLGEPANATLGVATGTGTITDDDPTPTLSIGDVTVTEGNSGSVNATFTVTLAAPSGRTVTVAYQTADASASAGSDYTTTSGTLTFSPGTTVQTLTTPVLGDTEQEGTETFIVVLLSPSGASLGDDTGIGTIVDDDVASLLSIEGASATEGNSGSVNATFTVRLSPASSQPVTVNYETGDVTAIAGSDYTTRAGSLTFAPGVTSQTLTVPVLGDLTDEDDETFTVTLSSAVNAAIGTAIGTGTIIDNDAPPSLTINNVTVTEGNSGSVNATFTVTLSRASGRTVAVDYATAEGTATAGVDYATIAGTLDFAPGTVSRTMVVAVLGDTLDETNESFTVSLSNASNATIADGSGLGTISDDDARPSLRVNDVSVTEGNSGTAEATFTVTLSAASGLPVTVNVATADGTAVAGSDYQAGVGTLSFSPGATAQTFTVAVLGDAADEPNETFTVRLSSAVNASVADTSGRATIVDDDNPPTISVNDVTVAEGAGTVAFTVSLSAPSGRTVSVRYATVNGTAVSGSDYAGASGTLSFAPGMTAATITVAILDGGAAEAAETFSVRLSRATNATLADAIGICTILDND